MIKLRIGGVPEHFNLPWHLALEARRFEALGIEVTWRDYPGGSGAMAKALRALITFYQTGETKDRDAYDIA